MINNCTFLKILAFTALHRENVIDPRVCNLKKFSAIADNLGFETRKSGAVLRNNANANDLLTSLRHGSLLDCQVSGIEIIYENWRKMNMFSNW